MAIHIRIIDDSDAGVMGEKDRKDLVAECVEAAMADTWRDIDVKVIATHQVYADDCDKAVLPDTYEAAISDRRFAHCFANPDAATRLLCIHRDNMWAQDHAARAFLAQQVPVPVIEYSGGGIPACFGGGIVRSVAPLHYCVRTSVNSGKELDFRAFFAHWGPRFAAEDVKVCWQYLEKSQDAQPPLSSERGSQGKGLCDRAIEAINLYPLIRAFTHSAKNDITNSLLAPARMLREHYLRVKKGRELRRPDLPLPRELLKKFNAEVRSEIRENGVPYGGLGTELIAAWEPIDAVLDRNREENVLNETDLQSIPSGALDRCMELLTEIRLLAGEKVQTKKRESPSPVSPIVPTRPSGFRVLVVDDNAAEWKPVIDVVSEGLEEAELPTVFEFSIDGKKVSLNDGRQTVELGKVLADYDLVLLDVYLPEQNGLKILKDIRKRSMSLPVIVWTTSLDRDLAADASLANGFLFKKTATCAEIRDLLETWLSSGRSQRLWSLPNPFFDHVLRDPGLRKTALAFTKWTLRYMDCFHAVDHFYFRYFNDHGGRHILGVLDATAKLLRPFLFDSGPGALLSEEEPIRNKQLFCLYIAVLCHEFGMFPIWKREEPPDLKRPDPTEDDWEIMDHMRKLHGVRGMLMLQAEPGRAAAEKFGVDGCDDYLRALNSAVGKEGCSAVAVMVGYHQRCLSLTATKPGSYTTKQGVESTNADARTKISKACAFIKNKRPKLENSWIDTARVFETAADAWTAANDGLLWTIDRVRKLCAILRLADALDIDRTRLPAHFLVIPRAERRPMQDVEASKRQVLMDVLIDRSVVSLTFCCSQPNQDKASVLLEFTTSALSRYRDAHDGKSIKLNYREEQEFLDLPTSLDIFPWLRSTKWFEAFEEPWAEHPKDRPDAAQLKQFLECCLHVYFACSKYKRDLLYNPPVDSVEFEAAFATAAAVLAVLEIESEYKSIVEVGLSQTLKLGSVTWAKGDGDRLSIMAW